MIFNFASNKLSTYLKMSRGRVGRENLDSYINLHFAKKVHLFCKDRDRNSCREFYGDLNSEFKPRCLTPTNYMNL